MYDHALVFVIGRDGKIKLILTYPMSTGCNLDEVLRVLDSMRLTARHKAATQVNWKSAPAQVGAAE